MSIARLCDICGKAMKSDGEDKEFFDLAVMAGDKPLFEGEDICPDCMARFEKTLSAFKENEGDPWQEADDLKAKLDECTRKLEAETARADRAQEQLDELEAELELLAEEGDEIEPEPLPRQRASRTKEPAENAASGENIASDDDIDIDSMSRDELEAEIERRVSAAIGQMNAPKQKTETVKPEKTDPPKPKGELREGVVKSTVFKMPETRGKVQGSLLD